MLLFILGTVCITPLLSSTDPVAVPREGFRGRTLLSVEPGNKVGRRWGCGGSVGGLARLPLHDHIAVKLWGLLFCLERPPPLKLPPDTECPLPLSQPFTKKEVVGFVIGSVSSVLYLFSRLPQIRTNVSFP